MSTAGSDVEGNHGGAKPALVVKRRSKYVLALLMLTLCAFDSIRPPTIVHVLTPPLVVAMPQMDELDELVQLELMVAMLASVSRLLFEYGLCRMTSPFAVKIPSTELKSPVSCLPFES